MNQHQPSPIQDTHKQVLLLLPWYVNRTLNDSERQKVESHLQHCQICKSELLGLRKLATAWNQSFDMEMAAAEASFANLRAVLPAKPANRPAPAAGGKWQNIQAANKNQAKFAPAASGIRRWFKPMAIAASVLLLLFPVARQFSDTPLFNADYYTLSAANPDSAAGGGKLRVVFAKSMPAADIEQVLQQINGEKLEGPNSMGAYLIQIKNGKDNPDHKAALAYLRGRHDVLLAEPINRP